MLSERWGFPPRAAAHTGRVAAASGLELPRAPHPGKGIRLGEEYKVLVEADPAVPEEQLLLNCSQF